ncbi:MAG: HU family DNA-binding protein [Paludibacteraceae bacterium]|nr:HU family DNA-binding protein [Paludibacteraceae bacterium]
MNTKEVISELKKRLSMDEKTVDALLAATVDSIKDELVAGNSVAVQGFGTFEVKKKEERISVNPSTKQRMLVPPKMSVAYKPSVTLKDRFKIGKE